LKPKAYNVFQAHDLLLPRSVRVGPSRGITRGPSLSPFKFGGSSEYGRRHGWLKAAAELDSGRPGERLRQFRVTRTHFHPVRTGPGPRQVAVRAAPQSESAPPAALSTVAWAPGRPAAATLASEPVGLRVAGTRPSRTGVALAVARGTCQWRAGKQTKKESSGGFRR
jgi:hypothetical protein